MYEDCSKYMTEVKKGGLLIVSALLLMLIDTSISFVNFIVMIYIIFAFIRGALYLTPYWVCIMKYKFKKF